MEQTLGQFFAEEEENRDEIIETLETAIKNVHFERFYRVDCPSLPTDRPPGWPHVIDAAQYIAEDIERFGAILLGFPDGIATFLWYKDKTQFDNFFNLNKSDFTLQYQDPEGSIMDMMIMRRGNFVTAGFREDEEGHMVWDPKYVYEIQPNGSWKAISCDSEFDDPNTNEDLVNLSGRCFAEQIIVSQLWDTEGSTVTVTESQ